MSLMIYTPDLAPSDPAVCKLGSCEGSNDVACQLVKEYGYRQNNVNYYSAALGQDSVFAFLMTGQISMALIEREITSFESVPYRKLLNSPPFAIKIAICVPISANESGASASVYVHSSNPLPYITMQQLSQVFARGNLAGDYSSWQQLAQLEATEVGSIHPLRLPNIAPLNVFLNQYHFDQRQPGWNGEYLGNTDELINKLATTPAAIGIAEAGRENPQIRAVPISDGNGNLFGANLKDMQNGHYPLTRYLHLYLPKDQHGLISKPSFGFAEFVLSPEGQKIINSHYRYAALSDEMVNVQSNQMAHSS